jgi:hypothetical protein
MAPEGFDWNGAYIRDIENRLDALAKEKSAIEKSLRNERERINYIRERAMVLVKHILSNQNSLHSWNRAVGKALNLQETLDTFAPERRD